MYGRKLSLEFYCHDNSTGANVAALVADLRNFYRRDCPEVDGRGALVTRWMGDVEVFPVADESAIFERLSERLDTFVREVMQWTADESNGAGGDFCFRAVAQPAILAGGISLVVRLHNCSLEWFKDEKNDHYGETMRIDVVPFSKGDRS